MAKCKFNVGDRVKVVASESGKHDMIGMLGTVCFVEDDIVGVRHDEPLPGFHACRYEDAAKTKNACEDGYGFWYFNPENQLRLLKHKELLPEIHSIDGLV